MKLRNSAAIFVQSLVAPDTKYLVDETLAQTKRERGSRWILDESLSPADLYTYLKARFGPPNGIMMIVRDHSSDNFIQWHYTLKSGSAYIEILGLNTRTEFMISAYPDLTSDDWAALIKAFKLDFERLGSKLKEIRQGFEKWQLFYNPYFRLEKVVENYTQELEGISLELPKDPNPFVGILKPNGSPHYHIDEFNKKWTDCAKNYSRALELSICIRLLCPVWGEAFINFLIFILARHEVKNDVRLYQDYIRKDIDIRIKLLHINCVEFEKPINSEKSDYKNFHSLMNERNDLLHGNIDPEKLSYEIVYFDGMIPLFTEIQGLAKNSLGNSLIGIEPYESLQRVNIVRSFISFILSHLKPSAREMISLLLKKRELGWRISAKRVGVLFGDEVIEGFAW